MPRPLPNYLRTHRLRSGLSQVEVALLLGAERDTTVSRHESSKRLPSLEMALAYELLYGVRISQLFAGTSLEVEAGLRERAQALLEQVPRDVADPRITKKLEVLAALSNKEEMVVIPLTGEEQ